jgi:N-acetylneuraminic acid mutarotase
LKIDYQTKNLIRIFKTITEKKEVAYLLSEQTVRTSTQQQSKIFNNFYGDIESDHIKFDCIVFGLMNCMVEDFYVVKEVLTYDYVLNILEKANRYIKKVL